MDQYSLDKLFKQGLENHKTALDKEALWAAINDKPSRKGFAYLKLLSSISIVAIIGLGFCIYELNKDEPAVSSSNFISPKVTQANQPTSTTLQDVISVVPTETATETQQVTVSKNKTQTSANLQANNKKEVKDSASKNISLEKTTATQHQQLRENSILQNLIAPSVSTVRSNWAAKSTAQHQEQNIIHKYYQKTTTGSSGTASPESTSTTKSSTSKAITAIKQVNLKSSLAKGSTTNQLDYSRSAPAMTKKQRKKVDCYEYGKKKAKISGEIYSSVDFVLNHFSANDDQRPNLERRDQTQTQLEGYRSGFRLKYTLPNGIYIKAGLEAGLIRERFNDEINETVTEIRPNQLLDVIQQGDSTIYIYGDAEVMVQRQQLWRVENTYKMLGIPVLLGYERQIGRFKYGIDMGVIHNVLYDFDGYLANVSGAPTDDPDFFRPSINLSLTGGVAMSYGIGARTHLFARASFKHNLEEINNDLNEIQQKNTRIGLGLGLEYLIR